MTTECEAVLRNKRAEYKLRNDLSSGHVDVSGVLAILKGGFEELPCTCHQTEESAA